MLRTWRNQRLSLQSNGKINNSTVMLLLLDLILSILLMCVKFIKMRSYFYLTLILLRCIQQPCGCNVAGQLQEPKDLTRPATVKVVYTILYSSEASLLQA